MAGIPDSATALLQTVVGSVITVLTLTFTLRVVALQLASQQFSTRLLRDFTRDRVIKAVLTVLVGTSCSLPQCCAGWTLIRCRTSACW